MLLFESSKYPNETCSWSVEEMGKQKFDVAAEPGESKGNANSSLQVMLREKGHKYQQRYLSVCIRV